MAVPEEIRKVERPPNTVVIDNMRNGPHRYAVRERAGVKYVPGRNPQPVNGRIIGHIIDGRFVPVSEQTAETGPEMLSYGSSALVRSVSKDLLEDLLKVYPAVDAYRIMAMASLKVIKPGIADSRFATHYNRTFISQYYPGIGMSKNTICSFLQLLGQDGRKRHQFYAERIKSVSETHHVAIDGTLKQDNSKVNDLSAYSYKARRKGTRDVSVIYAYDVERMEPICAEVFPGNCIDSMAYSEFIRDNDIRKGIIIADKGFPPSRISKELEERPDLHFLTPIKRNDSRIDDNRMLEFEGVLADVDGHIQYKKRQIRGGRFLYSFRDTRKAMLEEADYLSRVERSRNYSFERFQEKDHTFGVIVFESDQDLPARTIYDCYEDRWLLELVFNTYKNDEGLDRTRVQGDFSVFGSEFVNYVATVITCRILRKIRNLGLLEDRSYGDLMDDLSSAWRRIDSPKQPSFDDGCWVHTLKYVFDELFQLGLCTPPAKPEPKKRGRPRKNPDAEPQVKRPRGRPRKNPLP